METPTRTRSLLTGLAGLTVAFAGLALTGPAHSATTDPPDTPAAAVAVAVAGDATAPPPGVAAADPAVDPVTAGVDANPAGAPAAGADLAVPAAIATDDPSGNVIPDAGLRTCLAQAMVQLGTGAPERAPVGWHSGTDPGVITAADIDLRAPSSLDCYGPGSEQGIPAITSLTGLERFGPRLRTLMVNDAAVSDLTPLARLTGLTELRVGGNAITDLSPLAGLTNLTLLYAGDNAVTDVSPLAGLTELTYLALGNAAIADVSPLAGLTKLTSLDLSHNALSDVSPLAGMTQLGLLFLDGNRLTSVPRLAGLTKLAGLYLSDNQIADAGALADLPPFLSVVLDRNHVTDLSSLTCDLVSYPEWQQLPDCPRSDQGGTVSAKEQTASSEATVGVSPLPAVAPMAGDGPLVWSVVSGDARLDPAQGSVTYGSPGQVVLTWHGQSGLPEMRPAVVGPPPVWTDPPDISQYAFWGTVTVDVKSATPPSGARLELSGTEFTALAGPCGGPDTVSPATITASVAVTGPDGARTAGVPVDFAVDPPLFLAGDARVATNSDGVASVTVGLDPSNAPNTAVVPTVRASVAGVVVAGSPTPVTIQWLPYHATGPREVEATPSAGSGPVPADGSASWTVTAFQWLGCEKLAEARFEFTVVTGDALLSPPPWSSVSPAKSLTVVAGADGLARVTVTDKTAEQATISVQPLSAKLGTTLSGAPVTVEFVKPEPATTLTVDPAQFTVPLKGASTRVTVTSTDPWQLNCDLTGLPAWLHPSATAGAAGTSVVTITADPAPSGARQATLTVCSGDRTANLTVDQTGGLPPSLFDQIVALVKRILEFLKSLFTWLG